MALAKLNFLALSLLTLILPCLFAAAPANALSSGSSHNIVRRDHALLANMQHTAVPIEAAPDVDPLAPQPAASSVKKTGKIGIAWPNGDDPALSKWAIGQASCIYTWGAYFPAKTYGLEGVPMLWGPGELQNFLQHVKKGYATHVMGFNEPDHPSQANVNPTHAADLWKRYMNPLKSEGYTLISPATATGIPWMTQFLAACNGGCIIDIFAVHWYGVKFDDLQSRLEAYHSTFKKPIWLTEVACHSFNGGPQCNKDQVYSMMRALKTYANKTAWLEKIFWFGAAHDMVNVNPLNQLMSPDGSPNALGQLYLS